MNAWVNERMRSWKKREEIEEGVKEEQRRQKSNRCLIHIFTHLILRRFHNRNR